MERIDKLLQKASRLKLAYGDIFIISNELGKWKIGKKEFSTLEAAEQYIDEITKNNDALLIINDIGNGDDQQKGGVCECGKNQIKDKYTDRSAPYSFPSYEHGGKRGNGQQNSQYNHSWV